MKTIIVTTTWLDTPGYRQRIAQWYRYYSVLNEKLDLGWDFSILDNASSQENLDLVLKNITVVYPYRFREFHPRVGCLGYPSLWRAVHNFGRYFNLGYDKVVMIDGDFFLLSKDAVDFVQNFKSGWGTVFSPAHNFPEAALQIITKDCKEYQYYITHPESDNYGKVMECTLPWTEVNKTLVGNRYSEVGVHCQEDYMDFYAQSTGQTFLFRG